MSKVKKETTTFIEYYIQLRAKILVENSRLDVYKDEYKSIEAGVEPTRSMEKGVQISNQVAFINKLKERELELADIMSNYAKTLNTPEAMVMSQCVIRGISPCDVAKKMGMSYSYVSHIKTKIQKELDSKIIFEEI